jgi:hypothetical protein
MSDKDMYIGLSDLYAQRTFENRAKLFDYEREAPDLFIRCQTLGMSSGRIEVLCAFYERPAVQA